MVEERNKSYLEELYKISELMSSVYTIDDLLALIMDSSIKVTKADQGSLMLLDEERQSLRIKVARGLSKATKESVRIKVGEPIAGLVVEEGKPLLLTHQTLRDDPRFSKLKERKGIGSALSVPLKAKNKIIGVLNLNVVSKETPFTEEDIGPVTIFAAQAAVAIENAMLYAAAQQHTEELIVLNKIGKMLSSTFEQSQVINLMSKSLDQMIQFDILALLLLGDEQGELNIISQNPISEEMVKEIKSSLISLVSRFTSWGFEQKPIFVKKGVKDKDGKAAQETIKATLSLPLVAKDETIGAVSILSFQPDAFSQDHLRMISTLAPQIAIALENARIYIDMQELYTSTVEALAAEIETRNPYTHGHSERVTHYSVEMAKKFGFNQKEVEVIRYAGLLHDLGKIGISDEILLKPGKLTDDEYTQMQHHPIKSESILKIIAFLKEILPIVRHHHEHYNGAGYPNKLKGKEIPLGARIIAVADAFDAMTSDRPYRKAKSKEEAIEILKGCAGTQFDPHIVKAFLEVVESEGKLE